MELDTTLLQPWQRVSDSDYMSEKVLVWATLLHSAGEALEQVAVELRDLPGADEAADQLALAQQLVTIVEEELAPLSAS